MLWGRILLPLLPTPAFAGDRHRDFYLRAVQPWPLKTKVKIHHVPNADCSLLDGQ